MSKGNNETPRENLEIRGQWKCPIGPGRTVVIGQRTSGKFFRLYDKSKLHQVKNGASE